MSKVQSINEPPKTSFLDLIDKQNQPSVGAAVKSSNNMSVPAIGAASMRVQQVEEEKKTMKPPGKSGIQDFEDDLDNLL